MKLAVSWLWRMTLLVALPACGSAPPPKTNVYVEPEAPDPQSSEWLYATQGFGGDLRAECEHVRVAIEAEQACLGEACQYAARLSEDWLNRCGKKAPEHVAAVDKLFKLYDERQKGERVPCLHEIAGILKDGCIGDPECREKSQSWTTRCSETVGSPLVVTMLESRVESAMGKRGAKLDRRDCTELSQSVLEARSCYQKFDCEAALPALDDYRKRCITPANPPSFKLAAAELAIRLGAGQSPEPISIAPDAAPLTQNDVAVPTEDGNGIFTLVCDEQPKDLNDYLRLRSECTDGSLVMIQRQGTRARAVARVGRFAHPSDTAFLSSYPTVRAKGEAEARAKAGLERLVASLDAAIKALPAAGMPYQPEAGAALIKSLAAESYALRYAGKMPPILKLRDAELAELLKALAQSKRKFATGIKDPADHAAYVRRSLKRPLADVDADGNLELYAQNVASAQDFADLFPQAFSAYQAELQSFAQRIKKQGLSPAQAQKLTELWTQASTQCIQVEGRVVENESALVECALGTACEPDQIQELTHELEKARHESTLAYRLFTLAGDSLDTLPPQPANAQRCRQPWW